MKKLEKLTNIIEAILFASGDAVPIDFLREKLEITKRQADEAIAKLEKKYKENEANPNKKMSGLYGRLEEMQRRQEEMERMRQELRNKRLNK